MKKRHIAILSLILLNNSCVPRTNYDKLIGHYHLIKSDFPLMRYSTLDIELLGGKTFYATFDRYNIGYMLQDGCPIYLNKNNVILPADCFNFSGKVSFKSDTLVVVNKSELVGHDLDYSYWLKTDTSLDDIITDFKKYLLVDVNLSIDNRTQLIDSLDGRYSVISVGKLKKEFQKEINQHDDFVLQLNSSVGSIHDINEVIKGEALPDNQKIDLVLNADIETPQNMLDSIMSVIEHNETVSSIYRTYINEKKLGIGIKKIR